MDRKKNSSFRTVRASYLTPISTFYENTLNPTHIPDALCSYVNILKIRLTHFLCRRIRYKSPMKRFTFMSKRVFWLAEFARNTTFANRIRQNFVRGARSHCVILAKSKPALKQSFRV